MESLRTAVRTLNAALRRSRNFEPQQRVAIQMFAASAASAETAAAIAEQYEILKRLLGSKLTFLNDVEKSAIRELKRGWNAAVAADLQRKAAAVDPGYDRIFMGA
jgi:hypothetical protein